MDFDLIDAAGTAAIFSDGGKPAVLTLPGGARSSLNIFIDQETVIAPSGYENFDTEQRITITAQLTALPNGKRAPVGSLFDTCGVRYIVDDGDSEAVQDQTAATHIVRRLDG